ncbi:secondary thiamine-phosphate synthase enzyme [Desulfonauticus submarinus]|uniref:Secondary thiamine-phosphate synthase enzyme n=1 Tax=Desulfonauticus submarinus TaxID=206665 RepID=A0A1H0ERZ9_9BACT|nr:secondary thiamine-phosphate synthase enzyme YjbQ [Desulfonauticus submarinus]SDN85168.1 secondary thiamine-phosphate synthase enzyme [Desulfonauticus submarinus]
MQILEIRTTQREELKDITHLISQEIKKQNWQDGILTIFSPHTTGGITINEGADPSVAQDIIKTLKRVIPLNWDYSHLEGNSDAHIKTSLIGSSEQVIVSNGKIMLGTWQKIFFAEFDGPRNRKVWLQFIKN